MKTILHCDANNFYASVECLNNPALKGKPVAVCGDPDKRHGIVLAKNEIAKSYGVRTAEVIWKARGKCPDLLLVPPHYEKYVEISNKIFNIYTQYTDKVEPFGIDECWLDVTSSTKLFGSGEKIADELRSRIKKEIGITISVGVSFTKIFAKLGSDMKKPDATTVITPENFREKIWPLPAGDMLMIGGKTYQTLQKLGIKTIGDLAEADTSLLKAHIGINGVKIQQYARGEEGEDVREYYNGRVHKSIGHSTTMSHDVTSPDECRAVIATLSEMVAGRLRKGNFRAGGISVSLRYNDLTHKSRQCLISPPSDSAVRIAEESFRLFNTFYKEGRDKPLRGIGVATFNLSGDDEGVQLNLFDVTDEKTESLNKSIDKIRSKYGFNAIKSAALIKNTCLCDCHDDDGFLPFNGNAE